MIIDPIITIGIVIFVIIVFGTICFLGFEYVVIKNRSTSLSYRKKVKTIPIGRYMYLYKWFSGFPLTKNSIIKLHRNISALSIFTYIESKIQTIKIYTRGMFIYIALIILFAVLFQNLVYLLICMIVALVMMEQYFYKKIDRMHMELLKEELIMLSSLRQEYIRTKSVTETFESVTRGKYIEHAIKEIYDALCSTDVEERLEAFSSSTPLPTLQTLATISYIVDNRGDSKTLSGMSTFSTAIDMIADEVRMSIRRETTQKQLFGSLEFIPIVPIFGIVPIEMIFKRLIPGTAAIYEGSMGFMFTLIILVTSLIGYYIVMNATRSSAVKYDDRTSIDKWLMSKKSIREFVEHIVPRKPSKIKAKFKLLRDSLTRNTIDYLYLRKTYMCFGAFFIALIISVIYVVVGREAIMNNISGSSMVGSTQMSEEEQKILKIMDEKFLKTYSGELVEDQVQGFVKEHFPRFKSYELEEQANRLLGKYNQYNGLIFKWWMIWISFGVALLAYYIPEQFLKMRAKIITSESEEDCLQLQTTIAIMMNTSTDTLDLLECLYKNSRIFKSILIDCYHNYVSDSFQALRVAKAKTILSEFRNMIDKLSLTITQITIAEAFSDLSSERDHMLRIRESAQLHSLQNKRHLVRPFAMAPMWALIVLQFVAPICLLAFSMFTDIMSSGLLEF